jgi:hypothetical protein
MHQAEIVGREEELQARGASARVEAHVTDVFPGRLRDELQKFALPRHSTKYVELSVGAPGRPAEHGVHRFAVRRLVHAEPNSGDSDRCAEIDLDPLRRELPRAPSRRRVTVNRARGLRRRLLRGRDNRSAARDVAQRGAVSGEYACRPVVHGAGITRESRRGPLNPIRRCRAVRARQLAPVRADLPTGRLRGSRRRGRATRRRSGYPLGVSPAHVWQHHAIQGDSIVAQPWTGTVAELEETAAASVARDLTNRISSRQAPGTLLLRY